MTTDRRIRLWTLITEHAAGAAVDVGHVCAAIVEATGVDGVALAVTVNGGIRSTVHATDRVAAELEEITLTLGEGPTVDAVIGAPTLVPDLAAADVLVRWPVFVPAATRYGVQALFALPLQVGAIRLGVVSLYRTRPGELDPEQLTDALVLADTGCAVLLDTGVGPTRRSTADGPFLSVGLHHPEVHQATGMVIVQLGVSAAEALTRLRAHAYATDRRLRDVAADVIARRLRFEPDG